jgi:hypothetical protein
MKIKLIVLVALLGGFLASCGSSIDKDSLEGRVASLVENKNSVIGFASVDVNNVLTKSGVFDGALPEQYAAFIAPFKESLYGALNMDKSVFVLVEGPASNEQKDVKFIVLFEIKDTEKLKGEFKEMGAEFRSEGNLTYAIQDQMGLALLEGNIGMLIVNAQGPITSEILKDYELASSKKVSNDKLAKCILAKGDVTVAVIAERIYDFQSKMNGQLSAELSSSLKKLATDSYQVISIDFNNGEMTMVADYFFGKEMEKHLPMTNGSVSSKALSSIRGGSPIGALAMNYNFEKLFNLIYTEVDENTKKEVDKALVMAGGFDKVSKMLSGEIVFGMYAGQNSSENPTIDLFLGLNDASYLRTLVEGFGPMAGLKAESDEIFSFGGNAKMKLTDKEMIVSSNVSIFDNLINGKGGDMIAPNGFKFGAKPLSLFVDFTKLDANDFPIQARPYLNEVTYLFVEGDDKSMNASFKTKNTDKNILRQIVEMVIEGINAQIQYDEFDEYDEYDFDEEISDEELEALYNSMN